MDRKLYPCKNCGAKVPIRSKGLCNGCRFIEREAKGELPSQNKKPYFIKPITKKTSQRKKQERGCLGAYFDFHIKALEKNPYSFESGRLIGAPTIANIAHILPKRKMGGFPSIMCNIENAVYLTIEEHNKFDKLFDELRFEDLEIEFPKTWKKVCETLPKLLSLCKETNKLYFKLKDYLDEIESRNTNT